MPIVTASDGTKINYYLDDFTDPWKESETIVIAHGCGESSRMTYRLMPGLLAGNYKVLRIDERGHGESGIPPGGYKPSLERFADDVLNVMDHLGFSKVHFFGNHSGGWVGMVLSVAHPDRVKSLILCSTPDKLSSKVAKESAPAGKDDMPTAIRKLGWREYLRQVQIGASMTDPAITPEIREWYDNERGKNDTEVQAIRHEFAYSSPGQGDLLTQIKVPTLIITGANCHLCAPEMAVAMQKRIPKAQLAVLENGYSAVYFMQADQCVRAVLNFHRALGWG